MSNALALELFAKTKWMILRYFHRNIPVQVLLQKVPAILYRFTKMPSYDKHKINAESLFSHIVVSLICDIRMTYIFLLR